MNSIVSYPERGTDGRNSYRGNCSGKLIEDLIRQFHVSNLCDYMVGSGTSEDVAKRMGITGQFHDLNRGFDLIAEEIPERSEFTFWHPPYWDIIRYADFQYKAQEVISRYGVDPRVNDLSKPQSWDAFVAQMNLCMMKQFYALEKGGRMAVLVGDIKKKGKLYSMILEMVKPGTIENIVIKAQHNTWSDRQSYTGKSFIPIEHEYVLIVRKDNPLVFDLQISATQTMDIRDRKLPTWKDIVASTIEGLGGDVTLERLYAAIEPHRRAQQNAHWREKVRQTLQINPAIFESKQRGEWRLKAA